MDLLGYTIAATLQHIKLPSDRKPPLQYHSMARLPGAIKKCASPTPEVHGCDRSPSLERVQLYLPVVNYTRVTKNLFIIYIIIRNRCFTYYVQNKVA